MWVIKRKESYLDSNIAIQECKNGIGVHVKVPMILKKRQEFVLKKFVLKHYTHAHLHISFWSLVVTLVHIDCKDIFLFFIFSKIFIDACTFQIYLSAVVFKETTYILKKDKN